MKSQKFPPWLHQKLPKGKPLARTSKILKKNHLSTVCSAARCPNRLLCFSKGHATFLALGEQCTRRCGFCSIGFSKNPPPPLKDEPARISRCIKALNLKHVAITMVTRDDLPDQGASHIAKIILEIKKYNRSTSIEVLVSDFSGQPDLVDIVLEEKPDIFNHNLETVRSLSPQIRDKANYDTSLAILAHARASMKTTYIKSGLMVGLGEDVSSVKETLKDLSSINCDIVTIGQYLQASPYTLPVKAFIPPHQFKYYEKYGQNLGIKIMLSSPFIRSSYLAGAVKKMIDSSRS